MKIKLIVIALFLLVLYLPIFRLKAENSNFIKIKTESPVTSPILSSGKNIYFGVENGFYYSIDQISGNTNWAFRTNGYVYLPSIISGDLIYFTANDGRLYAVEIKTGKERWRFVTKDFIEPDTQPVIVNNYVYFGSRNGTLYALDKDNGKQVWSFSIKPVDPKIVKKDQIIIHFGKLFTDENNIYIASNDGNFYALENKMGNLLWKFSPYTFNEHIAIDDEIILIGTDYNMLFALNKQDGTILWTQKINNLEEERFYLTQKNLYYLDGQGSLLVIDKKTGIITWGLEGAEDFYQSPLSIVGDNLFITSAIPGQASHIFKINSKGKVIWKTQVNNPISEFKYHNGNLYATTYSGDLFKIDSMSGRIIFNQKIPNHTDNLFFEQNNIFFSSVPPRGNGEVYVQDDNSIELLSHFSLDIPVDQMHVMTNGITVLNKDKTELLLIHRPNSNNDFFVTSKPITKSLAPKYKVNKQFWESFRKLYPLKGIQQLKLVLPQKIIKKNDVYEIAFKYPDDYMENPWKDVTIQGKFISSKQDKPQIVSGYYFDKDTWKIRFSPTEQGEWSWTATFQIGVLTRSFRGNLLVNDSESPGFLKINPNNPYSFIDQNGKPFFGIGLGTVIRDASYFGNPLLQWEDFNDPTQNLETTKYIDLDTYLDRYNHNGGGASLFRWSTNNISFKLWKDLSLQGNRYGVNEGIFGDIFVSSLKKHNYRIMMTLFGFDAPLSEEPLTKEDKTALKHYLDYVIGRYGSYIDIWEITNEVKPSDEWLRFIVTYLKANDPYHHFITTSWERPDLPFIDINTPHWYQNEYINESDIITANRINNDKRWRKPVIYGEQGNTEANWDPDSASRMRIRIWTAFFNEAILIFWNTTSGIYYNKLNANIYLGPTEIKYIETLRTFATSITNDMKPARLVVDNSNVRAYMLASNNTMLAYFFHFIDNTMVDTSFTLTIPYDAKLEWINPSTGETVRKDNINKGIQKFQTPFFSRDIALKITMSH